MLPAGWLPSPVYGRGWGVRRGIRGACFAPGERHTAVAVCAPCKGGRASNCRQCHTVAKCSIVRAGNVPLVTFVSDVRCVSTDLRKNAAVFRLLDLATLAT